MEERHTHDDLKTLLSGYDLEWALRTIALASNWLVNHRSPLDRELGVPVTPWALAFLAKHALCHARWNAGGIPFKTEDLKRAIEIYEGLPEPIEFATRESDPIAPHRSFLRFANQQYPFQENHLLAVARMAIILNDTVKRTSRGPEIDLNQKLLEIHGMDSLSIIRTGSLFYAAALKSKPPAPVLSLASLSQSDIPSIKAQLKLENLKTFVDEFGRTVNSIRSDHLDCNSFDQHGKYAFNELQTIPLIRLSDDFVCLPCHQYLLQRVSGGLYFSLSDDANLGGKSNPFREKFGYIFEEYVGEQIREHLRGYTICPECLYDSGRRSPDWVLVKGSTAILVECKSSQLSIGAKTYFDDESLRTEAKRLYLHGVQQLARFVSYVEQNPDKIDHLKGVNRFFGLVVTYVPLYLANSLYGAILAGEVGALPGSLRDYQFLSISDLEMLLGLVDRYDPIGILERRASEPESDSEMGQFLLKEIGTPRRNRLLIRKLEELFGWSAPRAMGDLSAD